MKSPIFLPSFIAIIALLPIPAHAYIDAGTGSILIQGILAGLAGTGVLFDVLRKHFKNIVSSRNSPK